MTQQTPACACGQPIPTSSRADLCPTCRGLLRDTLQHLPQLLDDLNLTITRQTATGTRNGPRSSTNDTLAFNEHASRVLDATVIGLSQWARGLVPALEQVVAHLTRRLAQEAGDLDALEQLAATGGHIDAGSVVDEDLRTARLRVLTTTGRVREVTTDRDYLRSPRWVITANPATLVRILDTHLQLITDTGSGRALLDDLTRRTHDILGATDTPAPRLYLGTCLADELDTGVPCPEELYVVDHSDQGPHHTCDRCRLLRCHTCGAVHDVAQRRAWLKEALEDRLATAGDLARGLAKATDVPVTEDQIRGWERRGRLLNHGQDQAGRYLYRAGDVITLALEAANTKPTRHAGQRSA